MREIMIERMIELRTRGGLHFDRRTVFGEKLSEIDLEAQNDKTLLDIFEQMVRVIYTQK